MISMVRTAGVFGAIFLVFGVLTVSVSHAEFEFESTPVRLTVSSSSMQKFAPTKGGTAVECTTVTVSESFVFASPTTAVSVGAKYSNCETFLGQPVTVWMNSCTYTFHSAAGSTTGTVEIFCPESAKIEIEIGSICEYQIGSQNGLGTITFKNGGAGATREVTVEPNVTGITSTRTTNHFFCPNGGSTGTYTGSSTITGENANGQHIGVFVD